LLKRLTAILKDTRGLIGGVPGRPAQVKDWVTYKGKAYRVGVCDGNHWFWLADHEGETILAHIPNLKQDLFLARVMEAIDGE
jgi:hypothetical protein